MTPSNAWKYLPTAIDLDSPGVCFGCAGVAHNGPHQRSSLSIFGPWTQQLTAPRTIVLR